MRRLFSVLLAAAVVVSVLGEGYAAKRRTQEEYDADFNKMTQEAVPYDPDKDPDRINPSRLDPTISHGIKGRDTIINEQNAEEIRQYPGTMQVHRNLARPRTLQKLSHQQPDKQLREDVSFRTGFRNGQKVQSISSLTGHLTLIELLFSSSTEAVKL